MSQPADTDLILRNTFLSYFCSCQKKFYWPVVRRLFPLKKPAPLDMGSLVHEGLKVFHHPLHKSKPAMERTDMAVKQVLAKAAEETDAHDDDFDLDATLALVRGYGAHYPKLGGNVLVVEQPISFQMADSIFYRGTVDMLEREPTGELVMWEHKTARALSASLIQHYQHSPQIMGYSYCLSEVLKENVAYILLNFLIKTKTPQYHQEKMLTHKAYQLQWKDWALRKGEEIQKCLQTKAWEENRYQCYPFVGKPCPYVPLCWYGEGPNTLAFFRHEDAQGPSDTLAGDAE